jgi:hypothetical protein
MVAIQITVDVKEAMGLEVRVVEIVMIMVGTLMVDKINVVEEIMVISLVVRAGVEEGRVDLEVVLVLEVAAMEEEEAAAAAAAEVAVEEEAAEVEVAVEVVEVVEVNVIKVKGAPS